MGIRGDFGKLRSWHDRLEKLGSDEVRAKLSKNLAEESRSLILEGFKTETDPYGKKWPAKVFGDGNAVLVRSNELRRGWHPTKISSSGFRISPSATAAKYAKFTLGTGLWGPHKRRITPKKGLYLAFFVKGYVSLAAAKGIVGNVRTSKAARSALKKTFGKKRSGSYIFVRSVKGSPPRLMVPQKRRGLPRAWRDALVDTTDEFISHHLRGGK